MPAFSSTIENPTQRVRWLQAREMMYHRSNINRIMSDYTGQPVDTIEKDTDRDRCAQKTMYLVEMFVCLLCC